MGPSWQLKGNLSTTLNELSGYSKSSRTPSKPCKEEDLPTPRQTAKNFQKYQIAFNIKYTKKLNIRTSHSIFHFKGIDAQSITNTDFSPQLSTLLAHRKAYQRGEKNFRDFPSPSFLYGEFFSPAPSCQPLVRFIQS